MLYTTPITKQKKNKKQTTDDAEAQVDVKPEAATGEEDSTRRSRRRRGDGRTLQARVESPRRQGKKMSLLQRATPPESITTTTPKTATRRLNKERMIELLVV